MNRGLAVFLWAHSLVGLAGWEGIALVVVGLALIALEVFVIPGFGVAGVLGLLAVLGGLLLVLIGDQIVPRDALPRAGYTVGLVVVSLAAGAAALWWLRPHLLSQVPWLRGLILHTNVTPPPPATTRRWRIAAGALGADAINDRLDLTDTDTPRLQAGATGVALSDLRPAGFARMDGMRVDVVTDGGYISAGSPIELVADQGYRRVVRQVAAHNAGTPDANGSGVR